ncbi:MAG: hypothetical protein HOP11_03845 [Saprospiraceae bacterium]|nr:hypothetical protein [Saprospiraceae bacterium]
MVRQIIQVVFFLLISTISIHASVDSNIVFQPIYSKKEIRKESKDIKEFAKKIKSLVKSQKSDNIDLKNYSLEEIKSQMKKEYEELNKRITIRAKKISPSKRSKDTLISGDIPQGYNPTIKGQFEKVDKNEILKGKNETEILMMYSKILNHENRIIRQLEEFQEFNSTTPSTTFDSVIKNANEFKNCLKDELALLSKEKGKKK